MSRVLRAGLVWVCVYEFSRMLCVCADACVCLPGGWLACVSCFLLQKKQGMSLSACVKNSHRWMYEVVLARACCSCRSVLWSCARLCCVSVTASYVYKGLACAQGLVLPNPPLSLTATRLLNQKPLVTLLVTIFRLLAVLLCRCS